MAISPFIKVKDTRTKSPADLSGGVGNKGYSDADMAKSLDTLSMRADFLAEELGIKDDRGPNYRNWSGTAHLMIRSIIQPLARLADGEPNERKAQGAYGTCNFLLEKEEDFKAAQETGDLVQTKEAEQKLMGAITGMHADDPLRLARIGTKVAKHEQYAADEDVPVQADPKAAISQADLNYVVGEIYKFTYEVSQILRNGKNENQADLELYAAELDKAVKWVSKVHPKIEAKINPEVAAAVKPPKQIV